MGTLNERPFSEQRESLHTPKYSEPLLFYALIVSFIVEWWILCHAFALPRVVLTRFLQVAFNPSGNKLAVLDIAGGLTVVETSKDAASASVHGRR